MSVELPFPGLIDIRQPILGDSFGWAGLEPLAAKKSVVFHHSASPNTQDGFDFANYHVNNNGWNGVGYHFVITSRDYPGRAGFTPPGAQVQYVGSVETWRAHCMNQNPGRIGVCFSGYEPDEEQLKLARQLMEFFAAPNNILPSINFMSQATVHQLVPEQSTACPGITFPTWLPYLQGGAWPFAAPPLPTPPLPDPPVAIVPETPIADITPGKGGGFDYRSQPSKKEIVQPDAVAIDANGNVVVLLPIGQVIDIAGYFDNNGHTYARTVYSEAHGLWNGVNTIFFDQPNGQLTGPVEVHVIPPDPTAVQPDITDSQLLEATVPEPSKRLNLFQLIKEAFAVLAALIIKKRGTK